MPDHIDDARAARWGFVWIALLAIMGLALFVRVYGLTREPVSLEAFSSVTHLDPPEAYKSSPYYERWRKMIAHDDVPNLWTFLSRNRIYDPATMPLYYSFEYLWNRYISRSILSVRLISLLFGMLMIPLIYALGRDLYGRNAGLIAAFCVALSPIHRLYAREIRMYVLMSLLALFSVYTFLYLVRDGRKRWWALHGIANFLLMWTHPFALLVPFVEGLFLIGSSWRNLRRTLLWIGMHALLAIPPLIYIISIRYWSTEQTAYLKVPPSVIFMADLLADDAVGLTYQVQPSVLSWRMLVSPERANAIVSYTYSVSRALKWFFVACAVLLAAQLLRPARRAEDRAAGRAPWPWFVFLLLWWLVPPIVLYVTSVVWRPCVEPRYTVHCSFALYLVIAGAITSVSWKPLRYMLTAALVLFYGYEHMLIFKGVQAADWTTAGDYIKAEAKPDDLIAHLDQYYTRAFCYNFGPSENVITYAKTFDTLADQCAFFVGLKAPSKYQNGAPREAWAVLRSYGYQSVPAYLFEKALGERNVAFTVEQILDLDELRVYHVFCDPSKPKPLDRMTPWPPQASDEFSELALSFWEEHEYAMADAIAAKAIEIDPTYTKPYCYLGMSLHDQGRLDEALDAFRTAIRCNSRESLMPTAYIHMGNILAERGQYDDAIASLRESIKYNENYHFPYVCLGRVYLAKGDYEGAASAYRKALSLSPNDREAQAGLAKVADKQVGGTGPSAPAPVTVNQSDEGARRTSEKQALVGEGEQLMREGRYDGAIEKFQKAQRIDETDAALYGRIGVALLGKGDETGALMSLRKFLKISPDAERQFGALVRALFEARDYEQAWTEVRRIQAGGIEIPRELMQKLERDSGRRQ